MTTLSSSSRAAVQPVSVTVLTPAGRGALAVVGVAGEGAASLVDTLFSRRGGSLGARSDGAIAFGVWRETGEQVVVVRHSASRLEIHCHGGLAASAAVIDGLTAAGAVRGEWEDWLPGGACGREAAALLHAAAGPKAAMILARQAAGALDREFERLTTTDDRVASARRLRAAARVGLRLTRPWRVVLAGSVNAGKSSLMNAIAGHARSIVSPTPGTTRDVIVAPLVLGGWGVELLDVAGSRDATAAASASEREGIARAATVRETADLVLRVVPADAPNPAKAGPNELLVLTKCDLLHGPPPAAAITTSAVTGEGIGDLIDAIVAKLVPEEQANPMLLSGPVPFLSQHVEALEQIIHNG